METTFKYGEDFLTSSKALSILNGTLPAVISEKTKSLIENSYNRVIKIANKDKAVYGINTGFGPLCNSKIDKTDTIELQRNLLISHSVGVGDPIDEDISKLMLILKVQSLSKGYSGISLEIINRILWHIEQDIIPVVPKQGSVGASGDLAPLAHLFLPLIGEGEVFCNGQVLPAAQVLIELNIRPIELHPKSGLALINGTQFMLAHAVKVVDALHNCLEHADIISAMMIEGLEGSNMPFHEALHKTRPHKGNIHVAERISALLKGSEILDAHKDCNRVQDPYSMRCIPQVHGSSRMAWHHLKEAVEIELNSVTDNPIVISEKFTISGGSFHGQPLALPLDYACLAAAELGSISDRRTYLSLEGKYGDTPKLLLKETGLHSGFMIVQYTSAALVSENKGLCFPSSADSIPTSLGQEDHVSMGSIGARKALQVCENLVNILAAELICAAQAMDFKRPRKSSVVLESLHQVIRDNISHATKDRIFSKDILTAAALINEKTLPDLIKESMPLNTYSNMFEQY